MDNIDFNRCLYAIVVGSSSDDFAAYATRVLGEYDIDYVRCDDVYSAAAQLAKCKHGNILVTGQLGRLIKEQGRLVEKISEKGMVCCCLEQNCQAKSRQIEQVKKTGAFVIKKAVQLEEVITKLLERDPAFSSEKKIISKATAFNGNEFACTKAEINALLEV